MARGQGVSGLIEERFAGTLSSALLQGIPEEGANLYWLGQAGFAVTGAGRRLLIDPYLSDSLAEKYRGKTFTHERMMPAPILPAEVGSVDLVLCTHHHTDHMDPATLIPIAKANPSCRFVVPRASLDEAIRRTGVGAERLIALDAGETVSSFEGISVTAVRAAHETLERAEDGSHRFLGYLVVIGDARFYHSGDTVPFGGLVEEVAALRPSLVLLPVNGRRPELTQAGIAGNLDLAEARALAAAVGAGAMIAHHYGMFAFNTADPEEIDRAARQAGETRVMRAQVGIEYRLR